MKNNFHEKYKFIIEFLNCGCDFLKNQKSVYNYFFGRRVKKLNLLIVDVIIT